MLQYVEVVQNLSIKYKLGLVDNYKLFVNFQKRSGKSYESLMLDGVHPNDQGHELIANQLEKEILRILVASCANKGKDDRILLSYCAGNRPQGTGLSITNVTMVDRAWLYK